MCRWHPERCHQCALLQGMIEYANMLKTVALCVHAVDMLLTGAFVKESAKTGLIVRAGLLTFIAYLCPVLHD